MIKSQKVDVPVALIFHTRDDLLQKVFDEVKAAKPSILFLIQDGPRHDKVNDMKKINKCREIVNEIDWECKVYTNYADSNLGTGYRIFSGIKWAFEHVEQLIILEDDCVPSQSFFEFCRINLNRYDSDERINMISGMNHLGEYTNSDNSYFYCKTGAIWGWATWKRVWNLVEYDLEFIKDESTMNLFKESYLREETKKTLINRGNKVREKMDKGEKLTAWSYQFRMTRHLYSQLVIVPKVNMISNIGISEDSVHATDSLKKQPHGIRRVFFMEKFEIKFPLEHPKYIIEDTRYDKSVERILGQSTVINFSRKIETKLKSLLFKK